MAGETDYSSSGADTGYVPELEQEVLGSVLVSGNVGLVAGMIRPEHFIEPLHSQIFDAMQTASERYGSASPIVVHQMFGEDERKAIQAGLNLPLSEYLARLASNCARGPAGLRHSVPAMLQQWARLSIGREAGIVRSAALDPGIDAIDLAKSLGHSIDVVVSTLRTGKRGKSRFTLAEASSEALASIEDARSRGTGLTGVSWGLADINRSTGGLQRGELTIMGARPGMGKTAVGVSVALKAAKMGFSVGVVSLEMAAKTLAMRSLSDFAYDWNVKAPYADMLRGDIDDKTFGLLHDIQCDFEKLNLQIEDGSGLSMSELKVKFDRMNDAAATKGQEIDLLVIDYLQLIAPSSRYSGNRTAEVTEISAGLRNMARENGIAILALSQLSRGVESRPLKDRRPILADLRDSGAIEQDADTVIFLFREAYYLQSERGKDPSEEADRLDRLAEVENKLEFIIAKNRNGPVKTIDLFIDIPFSAVRSAARFQ